MDKPKVTPKDFFLWAGAMISLYASVAAFVALIFDYLNYSFPDTLDYFSGDPYSSGISHEMAAVIILFPLFLILIRSIRTSIAHDPTRQDVWVRRWALYLTLFITIATIAGDLITLVMYFLNGDVTLRFALKTLTILLVASGMYMHFLADLRGFWKDYPARARLVSWAVAVLASMTIIAGFFIVGTPWQARLYRYDDQKVSDLQSTQYQIVNYWQLKEKLPTTLVDLHDPISDFVVPTDPQSSAAYVYEVTGALSFKLCATFNAATQKYSTNSNRYDAPAVPYPVNGTTFEKGADINALPWTHEAGQQCFERTIDPQRYPPFSKTKQM